MDTTHADTIQAAADKAFGSFPAEGTVGGLVMRIIDNARDNANVTVFIEHARPEEDWADMFIGSCASLLACQMYPSAVHRFFAAYGVRA